MSDSPNQYDIDMEREANLFARELLMPTQFVQDYLRKVGGIDLTDSDTKAIKAMAKKFGVTPELMTFRIAEVLCAR